MANEYHELITFIGTDLQLCKLEALLGIDKGSTNQGVRLRAGTYGTLCGSVQQVKRSL
jgi:hypothetical protein